MPEIIRVPLMKMGTCFIELSNQGVRTQTKNVKLNVQNDMSNITIFTQLSQGKF